MKVACIGEAMVELALDPGGSTARLGFAGDTLNTAIYLKRSAPGLQVSYVTRLGTDAFSERLKQFIAAEGVDTGGIEISSDRRVGLYAITTDAEGERSFSYWRDSSAARQMFQTDTGSDFSALAKYDLLYLSAITLAILPEAVRSDLCNWLAGYQRNGGQIAFDSNYRPALWTNLDSTRVLVTRMWELSNFALPSADDEMAIFGENSVDDVAARLAEAGIRDGALKNGVKGPISLGAEVAQTYPPARNVVDTTAAGDSFNGGYLAARLTGASQETALMRGHELATKVVGTPGAIIPSV